MTDNPDGWQDNPEAVRWVRMFFAEHGWSLDDDGHAAPDLSLDDRRAEAMRDLGQIKLPSELLPADRRAFAGRKSDLAKRIKAAGSTSDIDAIDMAIATLASDVDAQQKIAAARVVAQDAVAEAQARVTAVAGLLDRGALLYLNATLVGLRAAFQTARTQDAYTKVKADCARFLSTCNDAAEYGKYFEKWFKASAALIATVVADPKKPAWDARNAASDTAANLSEQGKFGDAKTALQAFNSSGLVGTAPDFEAKADFIEELAAFEAANGANFQTILDSGLKDVKNKKNEIANIRKLGVTQGNIGPAQARVVDLKAWIDGNLPLAKAWARIDRSSLMGIAEFRTALTAMEDDRANSRWGDALTKLNAMTDETTDLGIKVMGISVNKKLKASYEALHARATGKAKSGLKKRWDKLQAEVSASPQHTGKIKAALDALRDWLQIADVYDARDKVREVIQGRDDVKPYHYGQQASDYFNAKNFPAAAKAATDMLPKIKLLCDYLDACKEARLLITALPADPPTLRSSVQDALDQSDDLAKAGTPQAAIDRLNATVQGSELQALMLALTDYQKRAEEVEAEQKRVLSFVELAEVRTVVEDGFAAAAALAFPQYKFEDALAAMSDHMTVLQTVRAYATRRVEAKNTLGSLSRAVTQNPAWATDMFDGVKSLAQLNTDFDAGDVHARAGRFDAARTAYEAVVADSAQAMAEAINHFEHADEQDSNAGHSRDSHGAQVTKDEHLTRLMTGVAPGNRASKTNTSSSFHSDSDWLAGREIGAQRALDAGVDVSHTSLPWTGTEPTAQRFIIDHGRPIDIAYRGVRPKETYDANADEFRPTGTYETYEVLTGLTRALVNFIWECDPLDGTKHRTLAAYATAYENANGAPPVSIPGRWVMMQQFPWAEDWNQAEQRYDKPIT